MTPEEYHSVDEVMVAFKGKSLLRQFLPAKPHKWGFKLWARCGVSGFMYNFDLYQGKEPTERSASEFGMSGYVVLKLVSTLPPNRNFNISADNFFTSIPLVEKLKAGGFLFTGTIHPNRLKGCPLLKSCRRMAGDQLIIASQETEASQQYVRTTTGR